MRFKNENNQSDRTGGEFFLVPRKWLEDIENGQQHIISILQGGNATITGLEQTDLLLGEYISEKDAGKALGYKNTWFWRKRTSGELPSVKWGKNNYYKRSDLIALLDKLYKEANG
jgi:hypothetical protein